MSSPKKGDEQGFGMKLHIGLDVNSGVTRGLDLTIAKVQGRQV